MKLRLKKLAGVASAVTVVALTPGATPWAFAEPTPPVPAPPTPIPGQPTSVPGPATPIPGQPTSIPGPATGAATPGRSPDAGGASVSSESEKGPLDPSTMALDDLGSSDTIWFDGRRDVTSSTISFVVPKGLKPSRLNATLELPIAMRSGSLTVTQSGRTISRLPLPAEDQARLAIPLDGVQTYAEWATVTLTISALPPENFCWDPQSPVRLVDSSITFSGDPAVPTTVAEFLPSALQRISIAVSRTLSPAESEAALQLAAALTTRYGWKNTDIGVVPLPEQSMALPPPAPGERQIIVKEGPDTGLSLQPGPGMPALLISGPADELTNQTRLLTDTSLTFARSRKVVAGPLTTELKPAGDSTTLAELKKRLYPAESARPEVSIPLDQSVFAQSVDNMRVHVLGSYTPLPSNFNGELTAAVGDQIIDRWTINAEGTLDHWVDIPNDLVQRSTALKIRLHTTGDPGHCSDYLNPILRIEDTTTIQVKRASPPVPPGFRSLPQSLMPRVQIGMSPDTYNDTVRAAQILVGLQRNSALPLIPAVTTLEQATQSREPAILIAANGWTDNSLTLPFTSDLGKITIAAVTPSGDPTTLTLDPAIKYGSLQTVFDGQRSVLIATSTGDQGQLDELLRWLSDERGRWSDLAGRAVIAIPGSEPVTVPNRASDLPDASAQGSGNGAAGWIWWAAGGIAAIALAGAVLIVMRTHKSTAAEAAAEVDESTEDR